MQYGIGGCAGGDGPTISFNSLERVRPNQPHARCHGRADCV